MAAWRTRLPVAPAAALALAVTAVRAAAQGCAMCGSAVAPDDPLAGALNTSILFLMATPYALVGGAALWLVARHRRHRGAASPADELKEE